MPLPQPGGPAQAEEELTTNSQHNDITTSEARFLLYMLLFELHDW